MKKENRFFEELERAGYEWEKQKAEREKVKDQIIEEKGWDSEELEAWYAEDAKMEFPYGQGACKAYRAWKNSETDEVIMEDFTWDKERHDFIDALRKAGIKSLVVANQSTGLMEDLHGYAAEGCTMQGLCTITRKEERFGTEREEQILGIRFQID